MDQLDESAAIRRMEAMTANPLIGGYVFDTLENAADALAAATLFDDGDQAGTPSDQVVAGRHLLLRCVGAALEWELEHRSR
jgi:hypothetical protein